MTTASIALTQGRVTVIDEADLGRVSAHRWHFSRRGSSGVAQSSIMTPRGYRSVLLHRFLLDAPRGAIVDHANGDPLDNRRANLRFATPAQNAWNSRARGSSGFVGVRASTGGWMASISPNGREIVIGKYETAEQAAAIYNAAARRIYGAFARLNPVPADEAGLDARIECKRSSIARLAAEVEILTGAK